MKKIILDKAMRRSVFITQNSKKLDYIDPVNVWSFPEKMLVSCIYFRELAMI